MPEIKRRDNPLSGLHEFYIEDDGEEYTLLAVKQGKVEKQKRLAQSRNEEAQRQAQASSDDQG